MPEPLSPCTGLCRLDPASGWCVGCGRSGEEIGRWPSAGDDEKRTILARLPARLARLHRAADPKTPR
jgi:predicted Fe-S protein YdhL (DUF1289 family)